MKASPPRQTGQASWSSTLSSNLGGWLLSAVIATEPLRPLESQALGRHAWEPWRTPARCARWCAAHGKLVSHANAVEDGAVVRRAVADDAHAAHAQQRRAAVFAVIQPPAEFVERLPRQQRADLAVTVRVSDSRSTSRTNRPTPSLVFSATLPTKPSQTITSASR